MLVELMAHGTCFHGPQIQGLVLLALTEFPEILFLSLVNEGKGDRLVNNSDLRKLGICAACHFGYRQLGQLHLHVLPAV